MTLDEFRKWIEAEDARDIDNEQRINDAGIDFDVIDKVAALAPNMFVHEAVKHGTNLAVQILASDMFLMGYEAAIHFRPELKFVEEDA